MTTAYRFALALVRLLLLYGILCWLVLAGGLELRRLHQAGWGLEQPLPTLEPATRPPFLGINIDLFASPPGVRQAALARLHATGFGWARQRLAWSELEPQPGQFAWARSDALLQDLTSAGLAPVVVLDGSPAWARAPQDVTPQDNPLAPPADPATFAHFVAAFAQRYQTQVTYYQIWDEPNIAPHWGNRHIDPIGYAQLLQAAAAAIRQADPTAVILSAALAPTRDRGHTAIDELYFLQRLYAAGAATAFDAVAIQPFGFSATPTAGEEPAVLNFQRIKLVRRVMLAAGDGTTPLWAVRFGWNSRPNATWGTVSPAEQATFAATALTIGYQQWPWLAALGWMIDQPSAPADDPLWGFALTPNLATALDEWAVANQAQVRPAPSSTISLPTLLLLIGASMATGWRMYAALRLLPWVNWSRRAAAWPVGWQALLWGGLLLLYYVATWPPLIGLCWIWAAFLLVHQPQLGLMLAALLLPFHDHHKELRLVTTTWTIAPAYAALLCLLPGLLSQLFQAGQGRSLSIGAALAKRQNSPGRYLGIGARGVRAGLGQLPYGDSLALAWLGLNLLSSRNVWYWPGYWQGLVELALAPLLLYGSGRLLVKTPEQWHKLATALGVSGLLVALFGLFSWSRGQGVAVDGVLRLAGPYYSPNQAALYLERTLWLGIGLALTATGWRRWGWWGSAGSMMAALLLTASRGAWLLAWPAGLLLWLWRQPLPAATLAALGRRRAVLGGLALSALLVLGWGGLVFGERLANSSTIRSRFAIWQATLALLQDQPWFGVGPGGFFWRYPAYLTWPSLEPNLYHPHNLWLEFGALWGWFGWVWLLFFLVGVARLTYTARRHPLGWGLLAGLVAGLAHAQVDTFAALPDLAAWNWLALALLVQIRRVMPLWHDPSVGRASLPAASVGR